MISKVAELDYQHWPTRQLATRSLAKYCQAPRNEEVRVDSQLSYDMIIRVSIITIVTYPTSIYFMEFLEGDGGNLNSRMVGAGASEALAISAHNSHVKILKFQAVHNQSIERAT